MSWTIQINGGVQRTPEELGVQVAGAFFADQAADILGLKLTGDITQAPPLSYSDRVVVRFNSSIFFQGRVISTLAEGRPSSEGFDIEIGGPWWDMENLSYLQSWQTGEDDGAGGVSDLIRTQSRIILGEDNNGMKISVNDVIDNLITFAANNGVSIALGSLPSVNVTAWVTEYQGQTVANALRAMLRWHPDVVTEIDYSFATPRINFVRRSNAPATTYTVGDKVSELSIRARNDLLVSGVHIDYMRTNTVNDESIREVITDSAGDTDRSKLSAVNISLDLQGRSRTTQTQTIESTQVPGAGGLSLNSPGARNWFKRQEPRLSVFANASDLTFAQKSYEKVERPEAAFEDPTTEELREIHDVSIDALDYELINGTAEEWMSVKAHEVHWSGSVVFNGDESNLTDDQKLLFFQRDSNGKPQAPLDFVFTAVDTATRNKKRTLSSQQEEQVPLGIAQHYFNALDDLQYEGSIVLTDEEVELSSGIGGVVNVLNGNASWANMRAQVQRVRMNLIEGVTTKFFGPSQSLAPQDLLELQRVASRNPYAQNQGRDSNEPRNELAAGTYAVPNTRPLSNGGGNAALFCPFDMSFNDDGSNPAQRGVTVNAGAITDGTSNIIIPEQNLTLTPDTAVWITVNWDTIVDDSILRKGGTISGTPSVNTGSTIPDNTVPRGQDPSGVVIVPLGVLDSNGNLAPFCGNKKVYFCPGVGFTIVNTGPIL